MGWVRGLVFLGVVASCPACSKQSSEPLESPLGGKQSVAADSQVAPPTTNAVRSDETVASEETPSQSTDQGHSPVREDVLPPSPFRQVLKASNGWVTPHDGHRIYVGEKVVFDLTAGELLASCDFPNGMLLSGKNLYFAARMSPYSACPDEPFLLEYVGKKWELRRFIDAHDISLTEWVGGTTIAAVVPYRIGPPWGYELVKVAGGVTPPHPKKGAMHPTDTDQKCYSELQRPISLHAFHSGALMVLGASRCDLPKSAEEELTEEEERDQYRPVIESFPRGSYQSTLTTLPLDEVLWSVEAEPTTLFVLGKERQGTSENAPSAFKVVSFDGKSVKPIEADLGEAKTLMVGPEGRLWVGDAASLRPVQIGDQQPLRFPPGCESPTAWFQGEYAWLSCGDGLYTTDPKQEVIQLPEAESDCDALMPRPKYAVRGIYKKASSPGGCGQSREHSFAPWGKGGSSKPIPRPRSDPDKKSKISF